MAKIPKKTQKSVKNGVYHFPLRLKEATAKQVRQRADTQSRSFNGQIEYELGVANNPVLVISDFSSKRK